MLRRVDTWLVDRVFQSVVDLLQCKPARCAQYCAATIAGFSAGQLLAGTQTSIGATLSVLAGLMMWRAACRPVWFTAMNSYGIRLFYLLTTVLFATAWSAVCTLLDQAGCLAFAAYFYFAACRPPRPRVPKGRLVPEGGV